MLLLQLGLILCLVLLSLDTYYNYTVEMVGIVVSYLVTAYFFARSETSKALVISLGSCCTIFVIYFKLLYSVGSTCIAATLPDVSQYQWLLFPLSIFGYCNLMLAALICVRSWWKYPVMIVTVIPIVNIIPLLIFGYQSEKGGWKSILSALILVNLPAFLFLVSYLVSNHGKPECTYTWGNVPIAVVFFLLLNALMSLLPNQQTIYAAFAIYAPLSFMIVMYVL